MTEFMIGEFRCITLDVGYVVSDIPTIFANAAVADVKAALERHHLDINDIVCPMHPMVVETGRNRVLIDPGNAPDNPAALLNALEVAKVDPASIDTVFITHGHADHWGGCFKPGRTLAFPQATHVMGRVEWEYWADPNNAERYHAEWFWKALLPIRDCFRLVEDGEEIVPGFQAVSTPGHSPGHMAILIGGELMQVGDAIFHVLTIEHPEWVAVFERDKEKVVQTRRALLQRLADENLRVMVYHFTDPHVGRIVPDGDTWAWVAEEALD